MSEYTIVPAVKASDHSFAPQVREAIAASTELEDKYARLSGGALTIGDDPVDVTPTPQAGLNTPGWARAVFIEEGDEVPGGTDPYTIVVEIPA
jgi:hypothetical protein